jgi:colanic acid biosynthesis glycosyl transferase WcaI
MRLLVVTLYYLPDGSPSAPLYTMLCEALAARGHEVTVIAAVPHYPSGQVDPGYRAWGMRPSLERGVQVVRVPVPSVLRADLKQRLLQFLCYQVGAALAGMRQVYDVLLITNPALEAWLPFFFLATLRRTPAVTSVEDVYPEVGVTLGIFRHRAVIKAVAWLERYLLTRSRFVRVLAPSFVEPLENLGISRDRMVTVPGWVDTNFIRPLPRDNRFSREYELHQRFVVLYAGNLGFSQGLEHVLSAAGLLRDDREMLVVLAGEGPRRDFLAAEARRRQLDNVRFLPYQPRARLPEMLASADVSLVTLQQGIAMASLPSKTFSILASGRPLLASVDEASDTWNLVQRSGGGICVPPENPEALAQAIMALQRDPAWRERLGRQGRDYALRHHSPEAAAREFERLLLAAVGS